MYPNPYSARCGKCGVSSPPDGIMLHCEKMGADAPKCLKRQGGQGRIMTTYVNCPGMNTSIHRVASRGGRSSVHLRTSSACAFLFPLRRYFVGDHNCFSCGSFFLTTPGVGV